MPIALSGVYLLAISKGELHFSADSLFYLLASLFSASYFVLHNQYSKSIPALALTTLQLSVVGVLCLSYSLIVEPWKSEVPTSAIMWLTISVLIGTNFRYMLQTIGQRYCNIANASIIMLLEPVWTMIMSVWWLDEQLTALKLAGSVLILAALLIYRIKNLIAFIRRKNY
ncbi:DMT family transporter [Gallibacterium anatis]|uniref:DMT family transporter n=1 Tax=Gallibacterium anatis TaxID=750 RepID=UPI0038B2A899